MSALEKTEEWKEGYGAKKEVSVPQVARQNEQSMALLTGMMAGTRGNPLAKKGKPKT